MRDVVSYLKRRTPPPVREQVRQIRARVRFSPFWCTYITPLGARDNALPALVLLGAQKSGTSSFFHYFAQHSRVRPPKKKEVHYFNRNYRYGIEWYKAHFCKKQLLENGCITFEATPDYLFHVLAPSRIAAELPDAKFVILLRDPVDRAYSHYWHERNLGREPYSFEEAIRFEDDRLEGEEQRVLNDDRYDSFNLQHFSYLDRGKYAKHIRRWLKHFPRDRFMFVKSETLFADPLSQMQQVFEFAGLGPDKGIDCKPQHPGRYDDRMDGGTRTRLAKMFAEANRELRELAGEEFDWVSEAKV